MNDLSRQEVDAKIAASAAEGQLRYVQLVASMKAGFADIRAEIAAMRTEMHKNTAEMIKWMLGFTVAIVTILTFVINNAAPKFILPAPVATPAPAPAPAPAPPAASQRKSPSP
jgi:hypothetical protein